MRHDIDAWCGSASVQDMNDAQYRAFHNLIMAQFQSEDGMLPDDERLLAKLSRKRAEWDQVREVVLDEFEKGGDGRLYNPRCYKEWQEAQGLAEARRRGGRSTTARRWDESELNDPSISNSAKRSRRLAVARQKARHTPEEWKALLDLCGDRCVKCGSDEYEVVKDHIVPLYQGGSDGIDNLQPLCYACNGGKGSDSTDHRPEGWRKCLAQLGASRTTQATDVPVITERNVTERNEEELSARSAQERPHREPTEAELDAVRMTYPRKTAPPKSREAIRRAVVHLRSGKDLPVMTTAEALEYLHSRALLYARSPAGQQGDFTPHCATWFHQGRYLEHESEWQRSGDGGRANGADRQRQTGNGGGVGSPAEQRVADNRSRIANAFGGAGRTGGNGNAGVADGGELLKPDAGRWSGRVVDAAVVSHSASA
ncbi:DUF1376 domain-containing protein [Terriglobus sp. ADX1]|uniref:DUF1376 domain-containing protein n=1 Tax=Terriglobus sp. ADX1 TaxID=2794063 RepID=UPI002FE6060D